ncbi:MAG: hypothetical protein RLP02_25095 [Coleofasciculus sp. C2-GNP5-27]
MASTPLNEKYRVSAIWRVVSISRFNRYQPPLLLRSLFVCEARIALPPPTRKTQTPTAFQVSGKVAIARRVK